MAKKTQRTYDGTMLSVLESEPGSKWKKHEPRDMEEVRRERREKYRREQEQQRKPDPARPASEPYAPDHPTVIKVFLQVASGDAAQVTKRFRCRIQDESENRGGARIRAAQSVDGDRGVVVLTIPRGQEQWRNVELREFAEGLLPEGTIRDWQFELAGG